MRASSSVQQRTSGQLPRLPPLIGTTTFIIVLKQKGATCQRAPFLQPPCIFYFTDMLHILQVVLDQ